MYLLVFLFQSRNEGLVKCKTGHMLDCIYTESINAHVNKGLVAVDKIIINRRVFSIQVEAVAVQTCDLNVVVIIVAAAAISEVMVDLIWIHCKTLC